MGALFDEINREFDQHAKDGIKGLLSMGQHDGDRRICREGVANAR